MAHVLTAISSMAIEIDGAKVKTRPLGKNKHAMRDTCGEVPAACVLVSGCRLIYLHEEHTTV